MIGLLIMAIVVALAISDDNGCGLFVFVGIGALLWLLTGA